MSFMIELPGEQGELVMKAIEFALSKEKVVEEQITGNDSLFALQADALVCLAKSYLSGGELSSGSLSAYNLSTDKRSTDHPSRNNLSTDKKGRSSSADNYQVIVHVDESALMNAGGKSDLPIESVRRLTCDGSVLAMIQDASDVLAILLDGGHSRIAGRLA